jgi:DNA-binding protein Fis
MKDARPNTTDISELYKQVQDKLESIVEKLLTSKMSDRDSILRNVHAMTERIFITSAMKLAENNVSHASRLLGVNRNTLTKKLKEMEQTV